MQDWVEAKEKINKLFKPSGMKNLNLLTSKSRFTPSEYFELEITDSPPPEVKKLGKQRKLERSPSDEGHVTKRI